MALLRPDFYNRVPAWVKKDPRRLQLFMQLLNEAEQDGYAEFSVLGYARDNELTRQTVRSMLAAMESRGIIESICNQQTTIVFLCNSANYIIPTTKLQPNYNQCFRNSERKAREETFPPHPL